MVYCLKIGKERQRRRAYDATQAHQRAARIYHCYRIDTRRQVLPLSWYIHISVLHRSICMTCARAQRWLKGCKFVGQPQDQTRNCALNLCHQQCARLFACKQVPILSRCQTIKICVWSRRRPIWLRITYLSLEYFLELWSEFREFKRVEVSIAIFLSTIVNWTKYDGKVF